MKDKGASLLPEHEDESFHLDKRSLVAKARTSAFATSRRATSWIMF